MRKDVLSALDNYIDGDKIRNRSHAIEYIVGRYLGSGINTCVILAAGQDSQTKHPLVRIHNRPIIAYTIEQLRSAGVHNIIMVINHNDTEIESYLEDGSQWGVAITYVKDSKTNGTTHSLLQAKPYISGPFLLMYGDILAEVDLAEMVKFHRELDDNIIMTLAVTACTNPSQFGVTELQGNRVYRIVEKSPQYDKSNLVFSGIAVCEPKLLDHITENSGNYLVRDVLPDIAHRGEIGGYPFTGKWFDVSHEEEYAAAQTGWIS